MVSRTKGDEEHVSGGAAPRLRLFRTTAFKLSLIYLSVFSIFAIFLIGYISSNTDDLVESQIKKSVDHELKSLAGYYHKGGIPRLTYVINKRSRRPGASVYLVTNGRGEGVAGNIQSLPASVLANPDARARSIPYSRIDDDDESGQHFALVRVFQLSDGHLMLVGRDMSELEQFKEIRQRSLFLTALLMVALGLASWLFVSRRVLKRIESVADTSRQIMTGDLTGRLEVTGTADEFDRLAISLNAMLVRIERLMSGLKEVSDNIAHDLKTPLTRMRNRVETALANAATEEEYREALQATIEDSDQLIRTFNALLMIARVEAGSSDVEFEEIDVSDLVHDVCELYEPLAEEAGCDFNVDVDSPVMVRGNRELLSQAVANLIDNAIKYSNAGSGAGEVAIQIERRTDKVAVVIKDNGPGIAEEDRERVTERFVRLEASRSKPGAGLGLSLVTAVAGLHDGSLEMSDNDPGLSAELILPVAGEAVDR